MILHKKTTENLVWVITKEQNNTTYYLYELDTDKNQYKWSTEPKNSIMFHNSAGAQNFVNQYIPEDFCNTLNIKAITDPY